MSFQDLRDADLELLLSNVFMEVPQGYSAPYGATSIRNNTLFL